MRQKTIIKIGKYVQLIEFQFYSLYFLCPKKTTWGGHVAVITVILSNMSEVYQRRANTQERLILLYGTSFEFSLNVFTEFSAKKKFFLKVI